MISIVIILRIIQLTCFCSQNNNINIHNNNTTQRIITVLHVYTMLLLASSYVLYRFLATANEDSIPDIHATFYLMEENTIIDSIHKKSFRASVSIKLLILLIELLFDMFF